MCKEVCEENESTAIVKGIRRRTKSLQQKMTVGNLKKRKEALERLKQRRSTQHVSNPAQQVSKIVNALNVFKLNTKKKKSGSKIQKKQRRMSPNTIEMTRKKKLNARFSSASRKKQNHHSTPEQLTMESHVTRMGRIKSIKKRSMYKLNPLATSDNTASSFPEQIETKSTDWMMLTDPVSGNMYWYNSITEESVLVNVAIEKEETDHSLLDFNNPTMADDDVDIDIDNDNDEVGEVNEWEYIQGEEIGMDYWYNTITEEARWANDEEDV
jgi:hypothetical protein